MPQVVRSRASGFKEGDFVAGFSGWQEYSALPAHRLRKVDSALGPLSAHLGALGMPGLTAYAGFTRLAEARAGQTVFVSSALGGVGAVVGQVARLKGRRVVGVSSSAEKCRFAIDVLGYNACLTEPRRTSPTRSPPPVPTASMSTSRTPAARCSGPLSRQ